jgi:hypothetical protein
MINVDLMPKQTAYHSPVWIIFTAQGVNLVASFQQARQ